MLFADDTTILGEPEEVNVAEAIFVQTLKDWEERVNEGKTERLFVSNEPRKAFDVRRKGEMENVRALGAWIDERARTTPDTVKRVQRGNFLAKQIAKAWGVGSAHGRGVGSGLSISSRLNVMRGPVVPAITTFARSRVWTTGELKKLQRVANYAVRRAMGMDVLIMYELGVSDKQLYQAAGWDSMADHIRRATML